MSALGKETHKDDNWEHGENTLTQTDELTKLHSERVYKFKSSTNKNNDQIK